MYEPISTTDCLIIFGPFLVFIVIIMAPLFIWGAR